MNLDLVLRYLKFLRNLLQDGDDFLYTIIKFLVLTICDSRYIIKDVPKHLYKNNHDDNINFENSILQIKNLKIYHVICIKKLILTAPKTLKLGHFIYTKIMMMASQILKIKHFWEYTLLSHKVWRKSVSGKRQICNDCL